MISISGIPDTPGIYIFKNKKDDIIYIGKARNLKRRVSSYFSKTEHDQKTEVMVKNIRSVDYIVTDSETEALILESNLIKKHQPKYNINLKDSKRYAYLHLTDEKFPRLILARKRKPHGRNFGPFISAQNREHIKKTIIKTFKLRTCKKLPKRPCLRYHIRLCKAPCIGNISSASYDHDVSKAVKVLQGKTGQLIKDLKKDMEKASAELNFERALELREQIFSLSYLSEQQKMERQKKVDEDLIVSKADKSRVCLLVFNIDKGTLINKSEYIFSYSKNYLDEFIVQYYTENPVPKVLVLESSPDSAIQYFLEHLKGAKVNIVIPKKGDRKQLMLLAKKNLEISFFGNHAKVEALKKRLRLSFTPEVIECFDISHISGTSTVGSMVQFRNGMPDKANYRRFKIRSYKGNDDFKGIAEIVRRRYMRLKKEYGSMPDLVLIDGGKGQLSAAKKELDKLDLKVPVISIAKKEEEIFFPGSKLPLRLDRKDPALQFIQEIRDEAHRFAITYNRLLRKKSFYDQ